MSRIEHLPSGLCRIKHEVVIACAIEAVFDDVADGRNEPEYRPPAAIDRWRGIRE